MFVDEFGAEINVEECEVVEQKFAAQFVKAEDVVLELGARYGTVTVKIQERLARKHLHVAVEPDATVLPCLRDNLQRHGSRARILDSIVSKTRGALEGKGYGTYVRLHPDESAQCCASTTVEQLEAELGVPFSALIADCEGCLGPFLQDFPTLLERLRMVMFETDEGYGQTDYASIHAQLIALGFQNTAFENNQFVYEKTVD
jgi:FkbM family methyltransferase